MLAKEITPIIVQQAKTCQLLQETTQSRGREKVRVHLHQTCPTLIIVLLELSLDYNPAADIMCDNFYMKIFLFTLVVN